MSARYCGVMVSVTFTVEASFGVPYSASNSAKVVIVAISCRAPADALRRGGRDNEHPVE